MIARVSAWVDECLDDADRDDRCYVAHTRTERERMRKAVRVEQAIEVMPRVFARAGQWHELRPAARAWRLMRAYQELHPERVFCGPSAALAYGLSVSHRFLDTLWVATTRTHHMRSDSTVRSIVVTDDTAVVVQGLRLTSLGRTVGDCLRTMDFRSGLAIADSALRTKGLDVKGLANQVEAACPRMPGLRRIRELIRLSDSRSESGGESIARATMLELGFAMPVLQYVITDPLDPLRHYRADFAWSVANKHILGELDGFEKYRDAEMRDGRSLEHVIRMEHRRQTLIEAREGVQRVVRFSFADVLNDWGFLALLTSCGVPRTFAHDEHVLRAGGVLRCRR